MSPPRYTIILPASSPEQPVSADTLKAFARLFNIDEDLSRQLFSQAPIPLKKELDALAAKKFVYALKRIDIEVNVVRCSSPETAELPCMPSPPLGYTFSVTGAPHGAFVSIQVPQGKGIRTEASSLITISDNLHMVAKMDGGFGLRLKAETLFLNEFRSTEGAGTIGVAPALPGEILHIYLTGQQTLYLCSNNYLASSPEVQLDDAPQTVCAPRDLLACRGPGDIWFYCGGAALPMELNSSLYVRPDLLVAWIGDLMYQDPELQSPTRSLEEVTPCRLAGCGRLWLQTCSENVIAQWCDSVIHGAKE